MAFTNQFKSLAGVFELAIETNEQTTLKLYQTK
jgi:hypothetical protein